MQKSVAGIRDCYGCGVCVAACPHRVLELKHDKNGFYTPTMVNEKACTDCGICRNVCSYVDEALVVNQPVQEWQAMWSKNAEVRSNCSSGGVAFELAKKAIEDGYLVVGVRYNAEKHRAKGNGFGFGLVDLDGIARTLSARYYKDGSEILIPQGDKKNPRRLSPRECARLMGYPDEYRLDQVSDVQAYRQCGNSVVVPLMSLSLFILASLSLFFGSIPRTANRRALDGFFFNNSPRVILFTFPLYPL